MTFSRGYTTNSARSWSIGKSKYYRRKHYSTHKSTEVSLNQTNLYLTTNLYLKYTTIIKSTKPIKIKLIKVISTNRILVSSLTKEVIVIVIFNQDTNYKLLTLSIYKIYQISPINTKDKSVLFILKIN